MSALSQHDSSTVLNNLSTGALDGIVELNRKKTDLTAGRLLSMSSSQDEFSSYFKCGWSNCLSFRSLKMSLDSVSPPTSVMFSVGADRSIQSLVAELFSIVTF